MSHGREKAEPGAGPITIPCSDGYELRGQLFLPDETRQRDVTVILCSAMVTRQRFYSRFADYLADHGFRVITFDNRGTGESLAAETRTWGHLLRDWGERDIPAVIAWAKESRPADRLFVVGHSMGGQVVALSRQVHLLEGIVTVSATAAWWGHWRFPVNVGILGWYLLAPVIGRILPAIPAERLGFGPDIASTLVRNWARWGRHREYIEGPFGLHPEMGRYRGRILALSFTDDQNLGCRRAVEALHSSYRLAQLEYRHIDPAEVGAKKIGHFGYFRLHEGNELWNQTIEWIEAERV